MDSSATRIAPARRRLDVFHVLLWLLFLGYGAAVAYHVSCYAGGADSSGYMNHARLLASGHVHLPLREISELEGQHRLPWLYSPHGLRPAQDGNGLVPTYPSGLPLLIAGAAKLVGWERAADVVLWFHAMAGVFLTYALGRTFSLSRGVSAFAATLVGGSPLFVFFAVSLMSDVPSLTWVVASILAAWHGRTSRSAAVASGAALGIAMLIRPTNALALVSVLVALGRPSLAWLWCLIGGVPAAGFFLCHAHAAYAKWLTTGYGDVPEWSADLIGVTVKHYLRWLPLLFTPVVAAFVALPFAPGLSDRRVRVLLATVVVFAGFYAGYPFTHRTWWFLRFLLPAAPAMAIGALLAGVALTQRWRARGVGRALAVAAMALAAFITIHMHRVLRPWPAGANEAVYAQACGWVNQHLPANAVIATMQTSGALMYYTQFPLVRWDWLHPADFPDLANALAAKQRPLYAVLYQFEIDEQKAVEEHMPYGQWKPVARVGFVTILVWSAPPVSGSRPDSNPRADAANRL